MSALVAIQDRLAGLTTPTRSNAQSVEAIRIFKMRENVRENFLRSHFIGARRELAISRLDEVRAEASYQGWDGYGAKPMDPSAYLYAVLFLNTLPTTAPLPEISADSDGEVSLDWLFGERKALTLSVGPTGRCSFAWMIGQTTQRGTDWIDDEIPASIVFALRQLSRASETH
jgi:hypothetical protein